MGLFGQAPEVTPAARLGASAGCSRATDRSEERQRVNRKCGQEARAPPGTNIPARPSL